jgi:hypothetical protein
MGSGKRTIFLELTAFTLERMRRQFSLSIVLLSGNSAVEINVVWLNLVLFLDENFFLIWSE